MASKKAIAVAAVLVGVAGIGAAYALSKQTQIGSLSFTMKVVNADTVMPIPGASVTYGTVTQLADAQGVAHFNSVPMGPLPLSASALGYDNYGPTQFSPQNGVDYDVPLAPTSGGVTYGNSFLFQGSSESAVNATVTFRNQNSIPIDASGLVTVKNAANQTVSLGNSAPQTVQPGAVVTFDILLSPAPLPGGQTYTFGFFAVDTLNRPVSVETSEILPVP